MRIWLWITAGRLRSGLGQFRTVVTVSVPSCGEQRRPEMQRRRVLGATVSSTQLDGTLRTQRGGIEPRDGRMWRKVGMR